MKTSYEDRAYKFAMETLLGLFTNCSTLRDYEFAISDYNLTHSRRLHYAHGVSRIAIIRADYVIKFDMVPTDPHFKDNRAGNCITERMIYERAERDGMAHLLAKTSVYKVGKHVFSIMPRINNVGDEDRWFEDYLTDEEIEWLYDNVCDIHDGNVGYYKRKPVVIDYAWDEKK